MLGEEGSVDRRGVEGRAVVLSSGPSSLSSSSSSLNCANSSSGLSIARKGGGSVACGAMVFLTNAVDVTSAGRLEGLSSKSI